MKENPIDQMVSDFEKGRINPAEFSHRLHVVTAFGLLGRYPFLEASRRYTEAIQALAEKAGAPGKFNLTITLAFLSLIAERMTAMRGADVEEFLSRNEDLLASHVLKHWYTQERLDSEPAHTQFLLPDRLAG